MWGVSDPTDQCPPDSAPRPPLSLAAVSVRGRRPRVAEDAERRAAPDVAPRRSPRGDRRRGLRLVPLDLDVAVEAPRECPASVRAAHVEGLERSGARRYFLRPGYELERRCLTVGMSDQCPGMSRPAVGGEIYADDLPAALTGPLRGQREHLRPLGRIELPGAEAAPDHLGATRAPGDGRSLGKWLDPGGGRSQPKPMIVGGAIGKGDEIACRVAEVQGPSLDPMFADRLGAETADRGPHVGVEAWGGESARDGGPSPRALGARSSERPPGDRCALSVASQGQRHGAAHRGGEHGGYQDRSAQSHVAPPAGSDLHPGLLYSNCM